MSFSDPSRVGEESVSTTPFRRPEVGLYLRFFLVVEPVLSGCVDILEVTITVEDQKRSIAVEDL